MAKTDSKTQPTGKSLNASGDAPRANGSAWKVLLAMYVAALGLGALAVWLTWTEVRRLPQFQVMWHDQKDLSDRLDRAIRDGSPAVREAAMIRYAGFKFTEAWRKNSDGYALEREIAGLPEGELSQYRRVQILAARLLAVEQRNESLDAAWPGLQKLVSDAATAQSYAHLQPVLATAWAAALREAGLDVGTARAAATEYVAHPQGPLAEFVVPRLLKLAAAREAAGDAEGAAACRRVLVRWLREWVLEPTALYVRLWASEAIVTVIEQFPVMATQESMQVSRELHEWRTETGWRPMLHKPQPLGIGLYGVLNQGMFQEFLGAIAHLNWIAAAILGTSISMILAGALSFTRPLVRAPTVRTLMLSLLLAFVIEWLRFAYESGGRRFLNEMRGDWSSMEYGWNFALASLVIGLLLSAFGGLLSPRLQPAISSAQRIAFVSAVMIMLLATFAIGLRVVTESQRVALERSTAANFDDPAAAICARFPATISDELEALNP